MKTDWTIGQYRIQHRGKSAQVWAMQSNGSEVFMSDSGPVGRALLAACHQLEAIQDTFQTESREYPLGIDSIDKVSSFHLVHDLDNKNSNFLIRRIIVPAKIADDFILTELLIDGINKLPNEVSAAMFSETAIGVNLKLPPGKKFAICGRTRDGESHRFLACLVGKLVTIL